jgi:glycosyltransferase involved in cell wall biosynthesis
MTTDAVGGVWTYALQLSRGLASLGIEVQLAVLGPAPSPEQAQDARAVPGLSLVCTELPLDWTAAEPSALDAGAAWLMSLAVNAGADLVHLNAPAHAGTSRWPLPTVVAAHSCVGTWWRAAGQGPLPPDLAWRRERTAVGLALADHVLSPSRSFAAALRAEYGASLAVTAVHNAVEPVRGAEPTAKDIVLTAGRLWDAGKDIATLDAAAARLPFAIFAAGPCAGPNGAVIDLAALQPLGTLPPRQLAAWYARAGIFVSVSRYEPFGLAVLEAAHAGAALVLSDIATFRELWDGAAAFVPAGDPAALADALEDLARDEVRRAAMGRLARQRARRFSPRRTLAGTLAAYRRALAARSQAAKSRAAA